MLDTNVLLRICTPGRDLEAKEWFRGLLLGPTPPELLASALADFEVRNGLRRLKATKSAEHYEAVSKSIQFVPVTTEATRRASELSEALRESKAVPPLSDADVLMAAQAIIECAILVTSDRELRRVPGLDVRDWTELGV